MENTILTPKQLLKQYFCKTGILLINIFLSATLFFGIISIINSKNIIERILDTVITLSKLGIDTGELLGDFDFIIDFLADLGKGVKVMQFLPLIPTALLVIGAWLIYASGKAEEQKTSAGFTLINIVMILKTIAPCFWALVVLILIIVAIAVGASVEILAILITAGLIMLGYFALVVMYYLKFAGIFKSMKKTYDGDGANYVVIFKYVVILNWILAILGALDFSSFWAFLAAALHSAMLIILTIQFKRYEKEVATLSYDENSTLPSSKPIQPNSVAKTERAQSQKVVTLPLKELSGEPLMLFKDGVDSERYELCGEKEYPDEFNQTIPMKLTFAKVYNDSISGRKLLHIEIKRNVKIMVSEIVLDIVIRDNYSTILGVIKDVKYPINNDSVSEYALVLPDEATNGSIKIKKIVFDDNLYWDKDSEDYLFYTRERMDFAVVQFLKNHEV